MHKYIKNFPLFAFLLIFEIIYTENSPKLVKDSWLFESMTTITNDKRKRISIVYQDENNLTSLRGTLVPAKTLNKMISKIPVIGKIVIPKEVGEGLFGVSFKMKGMPGKMKTTINPIKTLTPRFITKALEKSKSSK